MERQSDEINRSKDGKWIMFTGDQLGTLFASSVFDKYKTSGKPIGGHLRHGARRCIGFMHIFSAEKLAMVASTVSSKMIESMAKAEGFKFAECLTGMFVASLDLHSRPDLLMQDSNSSAILH